MACLPGASSAESSSPANSALPEGSIINLEQADQVEYMEKERLIVLSGNVKVGFEKNLIHADRIRIDLEQSIITAEGNLTWHGEDLKATGSRMTFNTKTREGTVDDVILTVGSWICRGDRVTQPDRDTTVIKPGVLTTCTLDHPHYSIKCKRIRIKLRRRGETEDARAATRTGESTGTLTATQVTFLVGTTPVFWLPAMVTPIREFRLPFEAQVGQTRELGAFVRTSPSYRLGSRLPGSLHLDHFQNKGWGYGLTQELTDAQGARIIRGHGYWIREKTLTRPDIPEERWQIFAEGSHALRSSTRISTRVAYVSDAYFRELYGIRRLNLPTTAGQRTANAVISQRLPGASVVVMAERSETQRLLPPSLQSQTSRNDAGHYTLSSIHIPKVTLTTTPRPLASWLNANLTADGARIYTWQNEWYVNSTGVTPMLSAFGRIPGVGNITVSPSLKAVWRDRGDRVLRTAPTGATEFVEDNKSGGVYSAIGASSLRPSVPFGLELEFSHHIIQRLNKRIGLDPLDHIYRGLERHSAGGRLSRPIGTLGSASVSTGYDLRNKQDIWQRRWSPLSPELTLRPHSRITVGAAAKYDMWDPEWRKQVREVSGSLSYKGADKRLFATVRPRYFNNRLGLPVATTSGQAYRLSQHVYGPNFQDASIFPFFFLIDSELTIPITQLINATGTGQYDAGQKRFAFYTLSVTRDLHCWELTGTFQQHASGDFQFYITMGLKAFPQEGIPLFRL